MTANELGGRVNHDVCSVFDRTEDDGSEGVVNNDNDIVFVCNFCNGIQVGHVAVRIAERLHVHSLCVRTDGCLECLKVIHVDDGVADTLSAQRVSDEVVRTAIEVVGCHDVVTVLCDVLEGVSDGCCTRSDSKSCHTTFEGSHTLFKHALSRVGQTAIDVTCIAKAKTVCCML